MRQSSPSSLYELEQQGIAQLLSATSTTNKKLRGTLSATRDRFFKPAAGHDIKIDPMVAMFLARMGK